MVLVIVRVFFSEINLKFDVLWGKVDWLLWVIVKLLFINILKLINLFVFVMVIKFRLFVCIFMLFCGGIIIVVLNLWGR